MIAGFNNKVSFNTAFKKFEGISPSAYKRKNHVAKHTIPTK